MCIRDRSYIWKGSVKIPESFENHHILDEGGNAIPLQRTEEGVFALLELNALSFTTLKKGDSVVHNLEKDDSLSLENNLVRYEFDEKGALISAYDKELEKEFMAGLGNVLSLYEDRPNNWDAWDVDFFYREALIETAEMTYASSHSKGSVSQQLKFEFKIGNSSIQQLVSLNPLSKRLDFLTNVDWYENHKMLRVHFPVSVRAEQASFDIQYGYVKRNTHRNTSWDKAKFEVVGHKYADLSDHDNGVALLNDCKYGYMVHDNLLDLNLLRSPTNPDPDADKGFHSFTYSLFPHKDSLIHSDVINEASCLNQEPILFDGVVSGKVKIPVKLNGQGLELSVLKKAEKEDAWIIRIIETHGRVSSGSIELSGEIAECDLMEWKELSKRKMVNGHFKLKLNPFEIKTFKIFY